MKYIGLAYFFSTGNGVLYHFFGMLGENTKNEGRLCANDAWRKHQEWRTVC